ncbi:MAG TPA: hypothetical protein DDZ89_20385, partial [Clostridiales bacterium]|nr:hypothetical protein [Clostridiales bacterium]
MNIGVNIKKTRRRKDMTQEDLAERLSVSVSAVSQWEVGKTTPDLSLIPVICNLFGITSDELLGIDIAQKKAKIEEISMRAGEYSTRGYNDEARKILTAGLKEFPDSYKLKHDLMYVAFWQYTHGGDKYDKTQRENFLAEVIKLAEEIRENCTNESLRQGAIQVLCFAYRDNGELDKAVELAGSMPPISCSSEMLLSSVQHTGTIGYRNRQAELNTLFQFFEGFAYMNPRLDSGEMAYTEEEKAALRDKQIEIFDLVFEDGDFGFYNTHLSDTHRLQAIYYAKRKDTGKTLLHIGSAARHATEFTKNLGAVKRTSLIFRGYGEGSSFITGDSDNDAATLL